MFAKMTKESKEYCSDESKRIFGENVDLTYVMSEASQCATNLTSKYGTNKYIDIPYFTASFSAALILLLTRRGLFLSNCTITPSKVNNETILLYNTTRMANVLCNLPPYSLIDVLDTYSKCLKWCDDVFRASFNLASQSPVDSLNTDIALIDIYSFSIALAYAKFPNENSSQFSRMALQAVREGFKSFLPQTEFLKCASYIGDLLLTSVSKLSSFVYGFYDANEVIHLFSFDFSELFSVNYQKLSSKSSNPSSTSNSASSTSSSSGGCFIATCVYGSYDCPQVWTLRRYRDYSLSTNLAGRLFIKCYYFISPKLVRTFGTTKWFKSSWKKFLDKKVAILQVKGFASTPYSDL